MFYYNLNDSIIHDEVACFQRSPLQTELLTVPGITDDVKNIFVTNNITNTYQLIGLLMTFYPSEIDDEKERSQTLMDKASHVLCDDFKIKREQALMIIINIYEKIDSMMPGFFDVSIY